MHSREFLKADDRLIPIDTVQWIDCTGLTGLRVVIHHGNEQSVATGTDAIEVAMRLKPSVLEGKRFRWLRHRWAVHNLLGHPVMQLLSFCHLHRFAFRVHDATVPRPLNQEP